jgi:hypothetical protein
MPVVDLEAGADTAVSMEVAPAVHGGDGAMDVSSDVVTRSDEREAAGFALVDLLVDLMTHNDGTILPSLVILVAVFRHVPSFFFSTT